MIKKISLFLKLYKNYYKNTNIFIVLFVFLRIIIFPIKKFIKEIDFIFLNNKNNKNILDIGCGHGLIDFIILENYKKNIEIDAIDINLKRINALTKISNKNINFHAKNLCEEEVQKKYDIIIMIDTIHHLNKQCQIDLLEKKLENILKDKGYLIIKEIDTYPKYKYYFNLIHDLIFNGKPLNFINKKNLADKLQYYNYKIIKNIKINSIFPYPHYLIIAQKLK